MAYPHDKFGKILSNEPGSVVAYVDDSNEIALGNVLEASASGNPIVVIKPFGKDETVVRLAKTVMSVILPAT